MTIRSILSSPIRSPLRSIIKPGILKPFYILADENGVLIADENGLLITVRS